MNPTREQFELAARAAGVKIAWGRLRWGHRDDPCGAEGYRQISADGLGYTHESRFWQPHLPGIDNAMLAAALKIDQEWTSAYAWAGGNGLVGRRRNYSDFPGTETERRAKAMAFCVFLVTVEIGRTMKEAGK